MLTHWLASYPRSGNTWARLLLEGRYRCKTAEVKGHTVHSVTPPGDVLPFLAGRGGGNQNAEVTFEKTHSREPLAPAQCAVVLVRDPRDTIVSYAYFMRDVVGYRASVLDLMQSITRSEVEDWSAFYRHYLDLPAAFVAFVRYEDLVADSNVLYSAVESLPIGLERLENPREPQSFAELHEAWPEMFRVGKPGHNRTELPNDLEREIVHRHHMLMQHFEYYP